MALVEFDAAPLSDDVNHLFNVVWLVNESIVEVFYDLEVLFEISRKHLLHNLKAKDRLAGLLKLLDGIAFNLIVHEFGTSVDLSTTFLTLRIDYENFVVTLSCQRLAWLRNSCLGSLLGRFTGTVQLIYRALRHLLLRFERGLQGWDYWFLFGCSSSATTNRLLDRSGRLLFLLFGSCLGATRCCFGFRLVKDRLNCLLNSGFQRSELSKKWLGPSLLHDLNDDLLRHLPDLSLLVAKTVAERFYHNLGFGFGNALLVLYNPLETVRAKLRVLCLDLDNQLLDYHRASDGFAPLFNLLKDALPDEVLFV